MAILGLVALILLIPLLAMQFSAQVNWSLADFLLAGGLLAITGLLIDFVLGRTRASKGRFWSIGGIALTLILLWIELAVGIFGTPWAGN